MQSLIDNSLIIFRKRFKNTLFIYQLRLCRIWEDFVGVFAISTYTKKSKTNGRLHFFTKELAVILCQYDCLVLKE